MIPDIFTVRKLALIRADMRLTRKTDFFRTRFFKEAIYSGTGEIQIADVVETRQMAPFALPSSMGRPIVKHRPWDVQSFKPAYIKLLDPVRPSDVVNLMPQELVTDNELTVQERFNMRTVQVMDTHLMSLDRTKDFMCARAVVDARVSIAYLPEQGAPYPEITIDFNRNPAHTVVLTAGTTWDDVDAPIYDDIQGWIDIARKSPFGGNLRTMIVGANVAGIFSRNKSVLEKLDTQIRGGQGTSFDRGLLFLNEDNNVPTYLGTLGGTGGSIEVFTYSDQQLGDQGEVIEMLSPNDVLLLAPGYEGIMAYGMIDDVQALGLRTNVFQKQYLSENPSQINMLTQSSPLPIPKYPNRSFKATVLL